MSRVARRDFLKTVPAAAGVYLAGGAVIDAAAQTKAPRPADVRLSGTAYQPVPDYPIRPKPYFEVKLTDAFWKPKVATNAEVTIPFEMQKAGETGRGLSRNVLEAAMLSLKTHPDPQLQAQVEARVRELTEAQTGGNSNSGFEAAATYYHTTGKRDLLDRAIETADALYRDFMANNPPFSGGERDAINCVQLYRATHDKKHLDLAKHYLDIRGLENSVNRSRHNQSYKPVLEQSEAVGHAVNCVTLMVSLADIGVLTGIKEYFNAAQRMWLDVAEKRPTSPAASAPPATKGLASRIRCRISPPIPKPVRC